MKTVTNKKLSRKLLLWLYALFLLAYWTGVFNRKPQRPPHTEAYVEAYGELALALSRETGVPPAIILAVGALESGWGSSELARRGNNHFGIKAWDESEQRCCLPTQEYYREKAHTVQACFRAYPDAGDSFRDFSYKIASSPRYAGLFEYSLSDYSAWARGLQACGYATDPHYADKLIRVVDTYRLHDL